MIWILQIVFIVLKALDVVNWDWGIVFLPLIVLAILDVLAALTKGSNLND